MKPYFTDDQVTLYHGDALSVLADLDDGSINCIVTSPPYFGLRDYGTGSWVGGDADCDHARPPSISYSQSTNASEIVGAQSFYRKKCGRCGAVREDQQVGLEASMIEYVERLRVIFAEARRVLADDGTFWLNLGDSYNTSGTRQGHRDSKTLPEADHAKWYGPNRTGLPDKNLLGIPWRVAFALQDDGWILRSSIIWAKLNGMPESIKDRPSNRHELIFLFSKKKRYWFDLDPIREPHSEASIKARAKAQDRLDRGLPLHGGGAKEIAKVPGLSPQSGFASGAKLIKEGGRNPGDVWVIATQPFSGAHFAAFPTEIPRRAILSGCKPGGVVLDPFSGSGVTGRVANQCGRSYVGIDLSKEYLELSIKTRLGQSAIFLDDHEEAVG